MTVDYNARFGDDPGGSLLDVELGRLLTTITHDPETAGGLPPEALAEIELATSLAWLERTPPTDVQLANEDDADFGAADEHISVQDDRTAGI